MEIIIKAFVSIILINFLYKYIKDNQIVVLVSSLTIFSYILLEINSVQLFSILTILISINTFIKYAIKKSKTMYQLFNIDQLEIIEDGKINYKNLEILGMSIEELIDKIKFENIDQIDLCLANKEKELTIYRDKTKIPTSIIVDGTVCYKNLKSIKKDLSWLNSMLISKNMELDQIFYAFYLKNRIFFIKSDES